MKKYKQNLRIEGNKVISYSTHVATISGNKLLVHGYWSVTTSKHVNYVAKEYGLAKVDSPHEEKFSSFSLLAGIMKIGEVFAHDQKGANNWKVRMLKAGIPEGALHMPEDWDTLAEVEKERRLNLVIENFNK